MAGWQCVERSGDGTPQGNYGYWGDTSLSLVWKPATDKDLIYRIQCQSWTYFTSLLMSSCWFVYLFQCDLSVVVNGKPNILLMSHSIENWDACLSNIQAKHDSCHSPFSAKGQTYESPENGWAFTFRTLKRMSINQVILIHLHIILIFISLSLIRAANAYILYSRIL